MPGKPVVGNPSINTPQEKSHYQCSYDLVHHHLLIIDRVALAKQEDNEIDEVPITDIPGISRTVIHCLIIINELKNESAIGASNDFMDMFQNLVKAIFS